MIKYSNNTINDWNFGASNLIKVYRNGAMVYYKVSGEGPTPEYQVCFAVVDDISQYSDREFEDVFNKADGKWYKLNNLNQYEEYGIYGSGRTSCEGSTSRLPQGYTEVEYVQNTASGRNTSSTSRLSVKFEDSITNNESAYTYEVVAELNLGSQTTYFNLWGNNYVQIQRLDSGFGLKFNARAFGKTLSSASFLPSNDTKYRMKLYQGVNDTYPQFEITDVTASTTSKYSLTNSWSGGGNT